MPERRNQLIFFLSLLRVKQWVKNTFIFFPIIFSGHLFLLSSLNKCLVTFFSFCLIASGLYILNDYRDRHQDRLHPLKSFRPLAQEEISPFVIIILILILIYIGLTLSWQVDIMIFGVALTYIFINLSYNFVTKKIVILDVLFIALGFQVRIWAGGLACGAVPSVWLQMCVFLLALFLGFSKRRHELTYLKSDAQSHRSVLAHYSINLLDQLILICATLAITFYGLYTMTQEIIYRTRSHNMIYSVIFVIYGMFRYLYLNQVKMQGGDPGEVLTTDSLLFINVLLWILYICCILYLPNLAIFS